MKQKTILAVTGPIASGKNEVCRILKKHGFQIIDADEVGHKILGKGGVCHKKVIKAFGRAVLKNNGEISREKLGKKVFADKRALNTLNRITHPEIRRIININVSSSKKSKIAVNAALIKEMKMKNDFDAIISVLSGKSARLKRLVSGRKMTRKEALKRIVSQGEDSQYKKISGHIIINNGSLKQLAGKVEKVLSAIRVF